MRRLMNLVIVTLFVAGITACSLTPSERSDLRTGISDTVILGIEEVRAIGLDPTIEVDEDTLKYVRVACRLSEIGSPLITTGLNILVDRYNEDAATPAERVTVEEFRGHIAAGCEVAESLLKEATPEPADEA